MKKNWDIITVLACLALCTLIGAFTLALPKKSFSAEENRALARQPVISARTFLQGKYFKDAAAFFSDHIALRHGFVRGRSVAELCLGRQEVGGVLFYADGALAQRGLDASEKLLLQNLDAIAALGGKAACAIVPRAIDVRGLPCGDLGSEAAEYFAHLAYTSVGGGELLSELRRADTDEKVYYATDHHLTTYGAYAAYAFLGDELGYAPLARDTFEVQTVTRDFRGTSYSAAGLLSFKCDSIELWRYGGDERLRITCEGREMPLYDFSFLDEKDKYRVFLGGNHGVVEIEGEGERPRLLLIKDSYANALIPFLALHFDITVVDPRYTNACWSDFLYGGEYDRILIFCGIDTISTGNDLARCIERGSFR